MILAGDIGGTKTLLGLFEGVRPRPRPNAVRSFATLEYGDLSEIVAAFLRDTGVTSAAIESTCFGVAGPVLGDVADLTNVPWRVDAQRVAEACALKRVKLLNDLESMAHSVSVLTAEETDVLQKGRAVAGGNMAIIAAGTGLGEAMIHQVGGRLVPVPSEGGHADFAARTEREILLLRELTERFGRVDVERVISGRGLVNIYSVVHDDSCEAAIDVEDAEAPAAISMSALGGTCADCAEALELFVDAYGAEAGNLALRAVATAGVFVGGGIAPKILPALKTGLFLRAFRSKSPLEQMLDAIPVKVILNPEAALLGAATYAATF
jgi:glucokinase